MSDVLVIAGPDVGAGFALAGVQVQTPPNTAAARDALMRAVASRDYNVVIIEQRLLDQLDERQRTIVEESNLPLVVSVPAEMKWQDVESLTDDDYVARLIRSAVGYQLNIQL